MAPPIVPTATKRARGSGRAKYANQDEPELECERPRMPHGLCARAKTVWKDTASILEAMGLLSRAEARPLARYCQACVAAQDAAKSMDENGISYEVTKTLRDGSTEERVEKNPDVEVFARMAELCLKLELQFGLTPAARTKIRVDATPKRSVGRPPGSKKDRERAASVKPKKSSGPNLRVVGT